MTKKKMKQKLAKQEKKEQKYDTLTPEEEKALIEGMKDDTFWDLRVHAINTMRKHWEEEDDDEVWENL